MPPQTGNDGTCRIRENIPWIRAGVPDELRPEPFEQHGKEDEVQENLRNLGRAVVRAQGEFSVQPENGRQYGRDQPDVIEIEVKEADLNPRLNDPTIDRVSSASDEERRIPPILETVHAKGVPESPSRRLRQ